MAKNKVYALTIQGLVQGVGFRPFIYRIATDLGMTGYVENVNNGVRIWVAASPEERDLFINRIRAEHPRAAYIHRITYVATDKDEDDFKDFTIAPSLIESDEVTQVSPDIAVCPDCLRDRKTQPHRFNNPFINCTHCGPRFSIIHGLPYDRERTTMSSFTLCADCEREYRELTNRRFHAQPITCNQCGPRYEARYGGINHTDYETILKDSSHALLAGAVIAVKGIGGYHLVCDARNERAVAQLRAIKSRDSKPFAVMFNDLDHLQVYTYMDEIEETCVSSWRRPIVLLRQRSPLASGVNPGMHTLGCMLSYLPIHYDWFARTGLPALVMTSGNLCDRPIAITAQDAEAWFGDKVAMILHHNRAIYNRVDDSVMQVCGGQACLLRRSKGYVPEPFFTDVDVEGLMAFGAENVCSFALGKGETMLLSQYIGDLKDEATFRFYTVAMEQFQRLFHFKPRRLVYDLHPDYLSGKEAERMSEALSLPLLRVQHHHAHAAACMLEYGLNDPVIAIVMDEGGMGADGNFWGGEFLLCDRARYQRLSHFEYIPLLAEAEREPWRMTVAYLWYYFADEPSGIPYPADFVERIGREKIAEVERELVDNQSIKYTSCAGLLFEAVASLLGICDRSTHLAEASMLFEQAAAGERNAYAYPLSVGGEEISLRGLFEALLHDKMNGMSISLISARFHTTMAALFVQKTRMLMRRTRARQVVVSGGCFQNKLLTETMRKQFIMAGIPVHIPSRIPTDDSGISIGQLTIASVTPL